jgi:SpoVK/Ycf46/Vps4 family AAA+-type ATPase
MTNDDLRDLPYEIPLGDDLEMLALIESWRYRGEHLSWDAIVGHRPQIRRCMELVEKLQRSPDELRRLRIRAGAGLVISGPAGVGKSLMARALANALGRDVIVPPTSELTAESIRRLYAQAAKAEPSVILLDEAEAIIGVSWVAGADEQAKRAFLAALDGIERPDRSPITVALTTHALTELDDAAIRPGRLAPRLVLEAPTAAERDELLTRAIDGLPAQGAIDLDTLVERTAGWSGAELALAVEEACSRSLLDHSDALRQDLLLEVVAERYVVLDERDEDRLVSERMAIHEAGHALYAYLTWPDGLASVELRRDHGRTRLSDTRWDQVRDVRELRHLTEMSLAGEAAEYLCFGPDGRTAGGLCDKQQVSEYTSELLKISKPYASDALEAGAMSDRGSERMRAAWHAEIEALAAAAQQAVTSWITPHQRAIKRLAQALLDAPNRSLSGDALETAIDDAMHGKDADARESAT